MIVKSMRVGEPPEAVEVSGHDVWLRRSVYEIPMDVVQDGVSHGQVTMQSYEEVHYVDAGCPSVGEVSARFDELWDEHKHDGMTDTERIQQLFSELAATRSALDDTNSALLEIGDMIGGE